MRFADLPLHPELMQAIEHAGFTECTEVQSETFEHTLQGGDVYVQSQTGTGKTLAFLVTIIQRFATDRAMSGRMALVVAPTRELATQIEKEAHLVADETDLRIGCFYGGVGYGRQEELLAGGVDIAIGTPGRLIDFGNQGKLDFRTVGVLVIDEADRLFDMGFLPDIRRIVRRMPPPPERQTMLYSATLNMKVKQLAWEYMNDPVEIAIAPQTVTVDEVTQSLFHVSRDRKMNLLLGVFRREQPERALVFTNTKRSAEEVSSRLERNGYHSRYIIGDLPQQRRLKLMGDMKAGRIPILVATDVAARGLHIDDVDLVVNYDLPEDAESYVHRIGRTARAGKTGRAITLACEQFVYGLEAIEKLIDKKIPVERITDDLMAEDGSAHVPLRQLQSGSHRNSRGLPDRRPRGDHRHGSNRSGGGDTPRGQRRPGGERKPAGQTGSSRSGSPRPHTARSGSPRPTGSQGAAPAPRPQKARPHHPPPSSKPANRPARDASLEERLAYYNSKYGESFQAGAAPREDTGAAGAGTPEAPKAGGLGRIFGRRKSGERRPGKSSGK